MYSLDEIIKDVANDSDNEVNGEWKKKINWLIEEAKAAEMYRLERELEKEFKEGEY